MKFIERNSSPLILTPFETIIRSCYIFLSKLTSLGRINMEAIIMLSNRKTNSFLIFKKKCFIYYLIFHFMANLESFSFFFSLFFLYLKYFQIFRQSRTYADTRISIQLGQLFSVPRLNLLLSDSELLLLLNFSLE